MKKISLNLMKLAVGLTIFFGVLFILVANQNSFKKIVTDDIENVSKLSSSIIYAEIDNSLTKPIFVGQTMANDLFLKNWLAAESSEGAGPEETEMLRQYLSNYSKKYGYDSVSTISAKSGIYYFQEGINKVVSRADKHDIWYYTFVESGKTYDLDVDTDEVNNNQLTVFANCEIADSNGKLMGVVGVGVKMIHLQELLKKYETQYDLKAFLIDKDGLVQVDSVEGNIETVNFFSKPEAMLLRDKIIGNKTSMEMFWYSQDGSDHCLITQYIDNLDWYIVIEKNTAAVQKMFSQQINHDLLPVFIIIVLVLLIISYIIAGYNRMLLRTAGIDDVTNLPNYKMFQEIYRRNTKRSACRTCTVFMFDIDRFKDINDRFGHLFGNTMLYRISEITKDTIGSAGVVARWGGDEFVGVIYATPEEALVTLENIVKGISTMHGAEEGGITVSLGAVNAEGYNELELLIEAADKAMYVSKDNGRNRVTVSGPTL